MNILIIDDHQTTLDSLVSLINSVFTNVTIHQFKNFENAAKFINSIDKVDLVITDLRIEGYGVMDMVDYCFIKQIPCLIFSGYVTKSYLNEAIKKNIKGYVSKTSSNEELLKALTLIKMNQHYFCPEIQKIINSETSKKESFKPILSSKEKELLKFLIQGFTMEDITHKMHASIHTLRGYRKNMLHNNKCNFTVLSKLYSEWYM